MKVAPFNVLVVDDEPNICAGLARGLRDEVDLIETTTGAREAIEKFARFVFQFAIVDVNLACDISGFGLLAQFLQMRPSTDVVLITGQSSRHLAADALNAGALDFIAKPVDLHVVRQRVRKARLNYQLRVENSLLRNRLRGVIENAGVSETENSLRTYPLNHEGSLSHAGVGALPRPLAEAVAECERATIDRALQACGRHREKTAKALGISVRTLHYKMGRYALQ